MITPTKKHRYLYGGLLGLFCVVLVATPAFAALVYGTAAPMTGLRTVGAPGLATDEADWQDAAIDWSIIDNGNGTHTYTYTFTNFNSPGISHVTLDLSDDATDGDEDDEFADPNVVSNFLFNGSPSDELEPGDKDGIIGAVKFDIGADGDPTYSFVSNRSPVFGDVFVKGGKSKLTNTGFGDHSSLTRTSLDFIARPNGVIPEPATLGFLLLSGLVLLGYRRKV